MRLCGFPLDATASWLLRLLVAPYKDGWRDPRRSLAHVLPCLEHLDICGVRGVSDHGVFALLLRCTHSLKELRMGGCHRCAPLSCPCQDGPSSLSVATEFVVVLKRSCSVKEREGREGTYSVTSERP